MPSDQQICMYIALMKLRKLQPAYKFQWIQYTINDNIACTCIYFLSASYLCNIYNTGIVYYLILQV